jgi:RNA polymerase sigma-70 factor, ECF subfamily
MPEKVLSQGSALMWKEFPSGSVSGGGPLCLEQADAEERRELLEQFAQGELNAFETLFREFNSEVYRWIVRIIRDPAAAEDLTLETFWKIYKSRARFDPQRSFGAWARRIATNLALDHMKAARSKFIPLEIPLSALMADPVRQKEIRRHVEQALNLLPVKLRVTAILALVEEEPYEQIAEALGISIGSVKSRVFRAVRKLREELKRVGVEP